VIDSRLLEQIDALPEAAFHGHAFRHLARQYSPLSGAGARLHGGRWNPPDSFSVLYLALEQETTAREFLRMAERQRRAPEDFMPRQMYRYEVTLSDVLDLRAESARARLGLGDGDLVREDAARCREVGACAHYCGREGILAPSATGQGTVLAVFFERLQPGSEVREVSSTEWVVPPPAA
jgi:RES domain-containing protein